MPSDVFDFIGSLIVITNYFNLVVDWLIKGSFALITTSLLEMGTKLASTLFGQNK